MKKMLIVLGAVALWSQVSWGFGSEKARIALEPPTMKGILGLVVVALMLFAFEVFRPDVVALCVTLVLILINTFTIAEGFSGFSNPAVITVIALFILSYGLIRTGIADWTANIILKVGGQSPVMLTIAVMLTVGLAYFSCGFVGSSSDDSDGVCEIGADI